MFRRKSLLAILWVFLAVLAFPAAELHAFHFPWDQGHDTFSPNPGDDDTDPGDDDNCESGSPFEAATGNFLHFEQDLYLKGRGIDIDITRSYNSRDMRNGLFGHGWSFTYDAQIVETTDGANRFAVCRTGGGYRERYVRSSVGSFSSPSHLFSTLLKQPDGKYTLNEKNGLRREYGTDGRLLSLTDRRGNRVSFAYDGTGFLTQITDTAGRLIQLTRGANGKVASIQDYSGRIVRYGYDTNGNLTSVTDPLGNTTTYQYDAKHNLTRVIDPRGNTVLQATYDSLQRVATYVEGGETWTITYNPTLRRTTKRDSAGNTWTLVYNENGNVTQRINPLGRSVTMAFDSNSNISSSTDENGNTTQFTYDASGNPTTITDALGNVTRLTYDPVFNQVTSITDPKGNVSRFEYNATGEMVKATNAAGDAVVLTYDARGQLSSMTDALGNATSYTADEFGNLVRTVDPLGNTTTFNYDALGNLIASASALNQQTFYEYDAENRLVRLTDAAGSVTSYTYDERGNLATVTDAKGNVTTFEYDLYNRVAKIINPLGQSMSYVYDKKGNVVSATDAKGQITTMVYDALSRLLRKVMPGNTIVYTYDNNGNVLSVSDNDSSVGFTYDKLNRLTRLTTGATIAQPATTISYTYDENSNRVTMTDPQSGVTTYVYDALNRMVSLTNPKGESTSFSYDRLSRRMQIGLANGATSSVTYDAAGRISGLRSVRGLQPLFAFDYAYDVVGNQTAISELAGNNTFSYDVLNQLIGASHPETGNPAESFSYDAVGNRLSSHLSPSYTHDTANRLMRDAEFSYEYDANGNLARKVSLATGAATVFTWDAEDQLVRVDFPGGTFAEYRYDGMGHRIQKSVNGQITRYVYDGDGILIEYDGSNNVVARYTHAGGLDDVVSMERGGASYFYHVDAQGSVVGLTDGSGQIVQTYVYDSYGRIVEATGTIQNPFCFTGRELDPETGLYYYRARYYDPATGRFLQKDPIGFLGGDTNLYAYVFNNPVNWVDPLGLQVGAPGFWESFIPVWGSGRAAINDFQCGRWGWGLFNTAMAVSDAFLVGSAVKAIGKGAWKLGSHTWKATRAWYGQSRGLAKGQHVHHWAIERNGPIGRHVPDWFKNQPWNLNPMPSPQAHTRVHGWGPDAYGPFGRWWHGTPDWAKNAEANAVGRGVNGARGDSDCNCND